MFGLSDAFSDLQVSSLPPHAANGVVVIMCTLLHQSDFYRRPQVCVPDHMTVQEIQVTLGCGRTRSNHGIVVVYGVHDDIVAAVESPKATFCNKPWQQLFKRTGITEGDLWLPESVSKKPVLTLIFIPIMLVPILFPAKDSSSRETLCGFSHLTGSWCPGVFLAVESGTRFGEPVSLEVGLAYIFA